MKKKILFMMLALTVSVALIVGATMAWFTFDDEANTEFIAGKVEISTDKPVVKDKRAFDNMNPGDCYSATWEIKNTGTKRIELLATIKLEWTGVQLEDGADPTRNLLLVPQYGSNWVFYQLENAVGSSEYIYAYYKGGPIYPEPKEEEVPKGDSKVELPLVIYFDGELTSNEYQGKKLDLYCEFKAVQATNEGPKAVFGKILGEDGWNEVNEEGYTFKYKDWELRPVEFVGEDEGTVRLKDIKCYKYPEPEEPGEDPGEDSEQDPELKNFEASFNYKKYKKDNKWYTDSKNITVVIKNATDTNYNRFSGDVDVSKITVTGRKTQSSPQTPRLTGEITGAASTISFNNGYATFNVSFTDALSQSNPEVKVNINEIERSAFLDSRIN